MRGEDARQCGETLPCLYGDPFGSVQKFSLKETWKFLIPIKYRNCNFSSVSYELPLGCDRVFVLCARLFRNSGCGPKNMLRNCQVSLTVLVFVPRGCS